MTQVPFVGLVGVAVCVGRLCSSVKPLGNEKVGAYIGCLIRQFEGDHMIGAHKRCGIAVGQGRSRR